MPNERDSPLDRLWAEYGLAFLDWDDMTLARWMAQTLGQLQGSAWRLSHPLVSAYRLVAQLAHDRQIWLKRLATIPAGYSTAPCCRAPLLPLLTREAVDAGLVCHHCNQTAVPFDEIPSDLQQMIKSWSAEYAPVHAVAHKGDGAEQKPENFDRDFEQAANEAEKLLVFAGREIMPKFLDYFPASIWEDQDECLEIRPEDIALTNED
jgi:hypothetical protein